MSLTPEQVAREREAFDKWFRDHYDIPLIRNSRAEAAYLARAEIAAAEREQLAPYVQHKGDCNKWHDFGNYGFGDTEAGYSDVRLHHDKPCSCGLDAILAPREKGSA